MLSSYLHSHGKIIPYVVFVGSSFSNQISTSDHPVMVQRVLFIIIIDSLYVALFTCTDYPLYTKDNVIVNNTHRGMLLCVNNNIITLLRY
jgi:hypothetical protein